MRLQAVLHLLLLTHFINPFYGCNSLTLTNNSENFVYEGGVLYNSDQTTIIAGINNDLPEDLVLDSSVTTIGTFAFANGDKLKSIVGAGVKTINDQAFLSNSSIESVYFEALETISNMCIFQGCTALKTVELPALATISDSTFDGCSSLTSLQLGSEETVNSEIAIWADIFNGELISFIPGDIAENVDLILYCSGLSDYNGSFDVAISDNSLKIEGFDIILSANATCYLVFNSITYNGVVQ